MTYEEFLDTEVAYELTSISHDPVMDIVYATVDYPFEYYGRVYHHGDHIAYHLKDGHMRKLDTDSLV